MKINLLGIIVILGLILSSCGRSPESQFYVLNPLSSQPKKINTHSSLRIGINEIRAPAYMSRPEVIIQSADHEVKIEEFHRWIKDLTRNTQNVIEANLAILMPKAAFVTFPWDITFRPTYQLQVNILQFSVDTKGNSRLNVEYLIYSGNQLKANGTLRYCKKSVETEVPYLVASMNENLNQMTRDLAKVLSRLD